ncbi:p115 like vesicle tethering protein [Diplogelasinospora grovesii]|uniref:type I protein arginine methyltransferase n=1 Tax=Diplogelasinospora grovesii TaxID=303347 RepID=A0AAN6SA89_9PEZI|nr:p115 like vesicle tethering protein [Diplogelasinospora grovesii]
MFSTITAAPAKQSVSETISVLSGRLSTATLLEDRRAAILGLRSFAKEYPASVSSGALRSLIGSLSRDGEDVDTVKVVMETLLMLFNPNKDSPEASEEIALWLADEFTQRQENITLLLDFLETSDFYSRLYSLQLLSAILAARTERTEECILVAPMGIPRLIAVLDDQREAVRNEAITLLTELTPASVDIQKLVAFERGFERVFGIIAEEGGLLDGARVVEDCLILLANLLRLNSSNQSMFREMGFIAQLGRLLKNAYQGDEEGQEPIAQWAEEQRNRNIYALLAVIRLFLVSGAVGTAQNQAAFLGDRVLENTLQLAFTHGIELPVKAEALAACADMIRGNAKLQEKFAGLQVPSPLMDALAANGQRNGLNGVPRVFVIDGLLDLILALNSVEAFDLRMAACTCLKAYLFNHAEVRLHFLHRAIQGHTTQGDELTNVLTTLLHPLPDAAADPYRYWFAAVLLLHLLYENPATKAMAMGVTEGDEASGEEVVTCIQTITAHFLSSVKANDDARIMTGYLMLLLCWLFEDLDGVNDFLGEFANLHGLIQAAVENPNGDPVVQGLSAMLVGVIYEFSTKDSPVPRGTVREIIMSRMGRDRYVDKLSRLRSHPLMRDHEVMPQNLGSGEKLPDVFFDDTFVEFFKDNYNRILRAIDREPGFEISVITNGVQKGISRELVDSLRAQVEEKERALQESHVEKASLTQRLGQEQADHRRTKDTLSADIQRAAQTAEALRAQLATRERALQDADAQRANLTQQLAREQADHQRSRAEITRLKSINDALQRNHEEEIRGLLAAQRAKEEELQRQMDAVRKTAEHDAERVKRRSEAERADLKATISRLEVDLMKANKARGNAEGRITELETKLKSLEAKLDASEAKAADVEKKLADAGKRLKGAEQVAEDAHLQAKTQIEEKEEERKATQNELDDLLIVFSDLEEKVAKYKERLKSLGEAISDDEEEEEGEDSADEEDDDEELETLAVISLVDDRVFPDAMSMLTYCKSEHSLDFLGIRDRLGLDFHGTVKLINFIRQRVHEGGASAIPSSSKVTLGDLQDDRYLKPVLDDDALILCLDDLPEPGCTSASSSSSAPAEKGKGVEGPSSPSDVDSLQKKNVELQAELEQLAKQFSSYRLAVQQTLDQRWGDDEQAKEPKFDASDKTDKNDSEYYFESYAHNDIHETMLKDTIRTDAYRDFIYQNKHLFEGKVVLDIGCGTGILSMFCAKAGAAQVIAVDNSAILDKARENIFTNGLESVITTVKGKIEEVALPVDKVDIIVSEWMGYCLLYEAMLPSVIWARDKYLKPDGLMVPSHSSMWIAPVSDGELIGDHITFWRDVYGFDMKPMQQGIYTDCRVQTQPANTVCGKPSMFWFQDLHNTRNEDLVFKTRWSSKLVKDEEGNGEDKNVDGFLVWFDIFFGASRGESIEETATAQEWAKAGAANRVAFTTGPYGQETHWKQGLLLVDRTKSGNVIKVGTEEKSIEGEIEYAIPADHKRGLNIEVSWGAKGEEEKKQTWKLH